MVSVLALLFVGYVVGRWVYKAQHWGDLMLRAVLRRYGGSGAVTPQSKGAVTDYTPYDDGFILPKAGGVVLPKSPMKANWETKKAQDKEILDKTIG